MPAPLAYPIQSINIGGKAFGPEYAFPLHVQTWHQLYAVLDGRVRMWVEGRTHLLRRGDAIWLAPTLRREPKAASAAGRYITVMFQSPWPDLGTDGALVRLNERGLELARNCAALARSPHHARSIAFHALCLHILGPERFQQFDPPPTGERAWDNVPGAWIVAHLEQIMDANIGSPLGIEDMAALVHISRATLGRLFQTHRGTSPVARFRDIRLERAMQMVRAGNSTITEIAHETGFSSSQHFATAFSGKFGQCPSSFAGEQIMYIKRAPRERRQRGHR